MRGEWTKKKNDERKEVKGRKDRHERRAGEKESGAKGGERKDSTD